MAEEEEDEREEKALATPSTGNAGDGKLAKGSVGAWFGKSGLEKENEDDNEEEEVSVVDISEEDKTADGKLAKRSVGAWCGKSGLEKENEDDNEEEEVSVVDISEEDKTGVFSATVVMKVWLWRGKTTKSENGSSKKQKKEMKEGELSEALTNTHCLGFPFPL